MKIVLFPLLLTIASSLTYGEEEPPGAWRLKIDEKLLAVMNEPPPGVKRAGEEEPHYRGLIATNTGRPTIIKCFFDPAFKKTRLEIKQAQKNKGKWTLSLNKKMTLTSGQAANLARVWNHADLPTLPQEDWLASDLGKSVIWIHELHEPSGLTLFLRDGVTMTHAEDVYTHSKVTFSRISREHVLMSFVWMMEGIAGIEDGMWSPAEKKE